jgi:hypothetical protein
MRGGRCSSADRGSRGAGVCVCVCVKVAVLQQVGGGGWVGGGDAGAAEGRVAPLRNLTRPQGRVAPRLI